MNGDSADPIIADAYAMGATHFDTAAALAAMVKGATAERDGSRARDRTPVPQPGPDPALRQRQRARSHVHRLLHRRVGHPRVRHRRLRHRPAGPIAAQGVDGRRHGSRASNWEYEFDPATGSMQARGTDGSFPPGAAFETSQFEPGGQLGFEEGNAIQYTWSVPQDLSALASLMGGDAAATKALTTYFSSLNATRYQPYDWSGNEPSEWAPWEFDAFGAPEDTQSTVRSIVDDEYADAPVDEPGNDDLGALSSWYVWGAFGPLPHHPRHGDARPRQPALPFGADPAARWSPPRRERPGGGGLPALHPGPDRARRRQTGERQHACAPRVRTHRPALPAQANGTCPGCRPR